MTLQDVHTLLFHVSLPLHESPFNLPRKTFFYLICQGTFNLCFSALLRQPLDHLLPTPKG